MATNAQIITENVEARAISLRWIIGARDDMVWFIGSVASSYLLLALYVAGICVLPTILITQFKVPFYFGGTALLIVVGVALDTISAIETHMITRSYEGFMKRGRIRGRR